MGTAVVTGARGVGYEVGRGLALSGVRVVYGVRSPDTGDRAVAAVRSEDRDADVSFELLDLADLSSVAAFGERMRAGHDRVDILVNNAGVVMPLERETTSDGFELHFGTNHLGHFALASELLPLLLASDGARVVVVGSLAHRRADIDFDDLHAERSYRRVRAYGQSKLANLLFMTELQRRSDAAGWGLTSVGAHPGFARTEAILRPDDSLAKRSFTRVMSGLIPTAERAARPIVHAATGPDVGPASYFGPSGPGEIGGRPGPARLASRARDPILAARLWDVSVTLTGATFGSDDARSGPGPSTAD
jgi:NAD(P)-dependent dehydrogenase (short-subunit alcohol dehydrogenase family)